MYIIRKMSSINTFQKQYIKNVSFKIQIFRDLLGKRMQAWNWKYLPVKQGARH